MILYHSTDCRSDLIRNTTLDVSDRRITF